MSFVSGVKPEPKVEDKFAPESSAPHVMDLFPIQEEPGAMYTCANCTAHVRLTAKSGLQCPTCQHLTGASTVFYKVREQPTTYDTI